MQLHADAFEHSLMKDKKIGLYMFFFSFLCFVIPDLDLGILKILICLRFHDVLQPGVY